MSQSLPFSSGCAVTPHTPKHGVRIPGSHSCNSLQPVGTFQSGGGAAVQPVHQPVGERGTTMAVVGVDGSHMTSLAVSPEKPHGESQWGERRIRAVVLPRTK